MEVVSLLTLKISLVDVTCSYLTDVRAAKDDINKRFWMKSFAKCNCAHTKRAMSLERLPFSWDAAAAATVLCHRRTFDEIDVPLNNASIHHFHFLFPLEKRKELGTSDIPVLGHHRQHNSLLLRKAGKKNGLVFITFVLIGSLNATIIFLR